MCFMVGLNVKMCSTIIFSRIYLYMTPFLIEFFFIIQIVSRGQHFILVLYRIKFSNKFTYKSFDNQKLKRSLINFSRSVRQIF